MKYKILFLLLFNIHVQGTVPNINKVIIWGYKLHTDTFSYINYALAKAFKHLNYKVYWLNHQDDVKNIDFKNTLFFTQEDQGIPVEKECIYILHNVPRAKYASVEGDSLIMSWQVFTTDCLDRGDQKIEDYIYCDIPNKVLYMPWATDLLPHEIDELKNKLISSWQTRKIGKDILFIGTHNGFDAGEEYFMAFKKATKEHFFNFKRFSPGSIGTEQHINMICNATMAPALQIKWQCDKGYIPCRIFKNISYGKWGITNNPHVYKLFNKQITYNLDPEKLLLEAYQKIQTLTLEEQLKIMDFVRNNHTYINRINMLFKFIKTLNNQR